MANPVPKISKADELKLKAEYQIGSWNTLSELAEKYGITSANLTRRVKLQGWDKHRQEIVQKSEDKLKEVAINQANRWTDKVQKRTERDWDLLDRSIESIAGSQGEVDPDTILTTSRARKLLDDMHRRSIGMVEPAQLLDIKSNGESLGQSLVSAIARLRQEKTAVVVSMEDAERLADCEIVKVSQVSKTQQ